ncbi:transmembrane protein 216 isoform 2-T2 [Cyanocitta cristata]
MAPRGRHRSSAPLQVLLFLNGWYCATYFLLEAFVFVYKVLLLPYPVSNLVVDVVLLLLYLGIEATRIFFARIPTEDTARGHGEASPVPAPLPSPGKGEDPTFPAARFTCCHLDTSLPLFLLPASPGTCCHTDSSLPFPTSHCTHSPQDTALPPFPPSTPPGLAPQSLSQLKEGNRSAV